MPVNHKTGSYPMTEEQLMAFIKRYDIDGDGLITRKELKAAFKSLGLRFSGIRARRAIRHADANGDGVISDEELKQLVSYAMKWVLKRLDCN